MLEWKDIRRGVQLAVDLHERVLVGVQLEEGVMLGEHLDNDLCTIRVSCSCYFQKACAPQAGTKQE